MQDIYDAVSGSVFFHLYLFGMLLVAFVGIIFWMRWKMRVSKGRFALTVVGALLTCLILGFSAASSGLLVAVLSRISEALGYGPLETAAPNGLVFAMTALCMILIYKFGKSAFIAWEAPPRVSDIELREKLLEKDMLTAAWGELARIALRKDDPIAGNTQSNLTPEVPHPVPVKTLLRDMLVAAISEINIPDSGWRADGRLWVGEKSGYHAGSTREIIAFVCDNRPTSDELARRLSALHHKNVPVGQMDIYALYLSQEEGEAGQETIELQGQTISLFSSRGMILAGLDLHSYARALIETFEKTTVGGTTVTLADSYVDLDITTGTEPTVKLADKLENWLPQSRHEHIALIGEYGQGKSTALQKFCYDWAKRFVACGEISERVPLLIELRGQSPGEEAPLDFLAKWCARYRLRPQQVWTLIQSGNAVVVFEGFDELRNAGLAFDRHRHFNALWRFAYPGTKLIFTGRPNFFLDQEEANRTLRRDESRKTVGDDYCSVWTLKPLDATQIDTACRSYEPRIKAGIKNAVTDDCFLEIASRPSMLPVIATIWDEIETLQRNGHTLTGAILIEKYIQVAFARKEAELERDRIRYHAPAGSRYLVLPRQVRELLTLCVAWRMAGEGLKNTIARSDIVAMVGDVYEPLRVLTKSEHVTTDIATGMATFEEQFADRTLREKIENIAAEICSAGLLVPDPAGGAQNLRFPHKQFFEFMIAKCVMTCTHNEKLQARSIIHKSSEINNNCIIISAELNSVSFLSEMIGGNINNISKIHEKISIYFSISMMFLYKYISYIILSKIRPRKSTPSMYDTNIKINNYLITNKIGESRILISEKIKSLRFMGMSLIILAQATLASIYLSSTREWNTFKLKSNSNEPTIMTYSIYIYLLFIITWTIMRKINKGSAVVTSMIVSETWKKLGYDPITESRSIRLFLKSLRTGKVQFDPPREIHFDDSPFLYPARDFGTKKKTGSGA